MWYIYIMQDQRGQNIIEYIFLVVAVLSVCLLFLGKKGHMRDRVQKSLDSTVNQIDKINKEITFS